MQDRKVVVKKVVIAGTPARVRGVPCASLSAMMLVEPVKRGSVVGSLRRHGL